MMPDTDYMFMKAKATDSIWLFLQTPHIQLLNDASEHPRSTTKSIAVDSIQRFCMNFSLALEYNFKYFKVFFLFRFIFPSKIIYS